MRRYDPSRTGVQRRKAQTAVRRAFLDVKREVVKAVLVDDAFGLRRGVFNRFCPTGPGGGIDSTCGGEGGGFASRLAALPKALVSKIKAKVADKYTKLSNRYGSRYAKAIVAAAMVGLPIPAPGAMLATAAPVLAIAELHRLFRGTTHNAAEPMQLTAEQIRILAAELWQEMRDEFADLTGNVSFKFSEAGEQIAQFKKWLKETVKAKMPTEKLWKQFLAETYAKGLGRSYDDAKKGTPKSAVEKAVKEQFLKSSFGQPTAPEKVALLAARSLSDLEGITDAMSTKMVQTLAKGLSEGTNPKSIAKDLAAEVDVPLSRAMTIARTEIVKAHAEGQLQALKDMGVTEIGVMVEWSTAGDDRVCPVCESMEGSVFTVEEAAGKIPAHPNCRCAFIPAGKAITGNAVERFKALYNKFCATGKGGGVDPTCGKDDAGAGGGEQGGGETSSKAIRTEPTTAPPPSSSSAPVHDPDVEKDSTGNGVTDAARVGVPGDSIPPPPKIGRIPNLTPHERAVEESFISAYESDPDRAAGKFRELIEKSTKPGEPPTFGTDDAKALSPHWSAEDLAERSQNRATLNIALHQTANAIAKRAFVQELDKLGPGDEIMVTVGGCGAGKGYALKNVPQALEMKGRSKVVWDSAGDQNATENPWIQKEAEKRGLKVNYVYVHADPHTQWAHPERGVVKRAGDPNDGRMVDAKVFADSYAIGAKNHQAFYESMTGNKSANFIFLENAGKPKLLPGIPEAALKLDRKALADFAEKEVHKADAPPHVKRGATIGMRLWGENG